MSGGTRSYEMARRMVASGHEVYMVTSRRDESSSSGCSQTEVDGIHVHWLQVPYSNRMSYLRRIAAFFAFAIAATRKARSIQANVVFATSTPLTVAIPAVVASSKFKVPMVFEVRDLWPELPIAMGALRNPMSRWLARILEKWAYLNSAAVVALSPGIKQGVIKAGYPQSQIATIPNSSDNAEFASADNTGAIFRNARPWLKDRPLLVYAGTFGKINGVLYLAQIAKHLRYLNPEICILLVGDGFEFELVQQYAEENNLLNNNLFIESSIPKKAVPVMFAAADIVCSLFVDLPEMRANSANKFFDALASGTPVFLNYGGWQHDLVLQYNCGLAMWGRPQEEVANEIASKLKDSVWLKKAGDAARRLAEERFDRDALYLQLEAVLLAAVNGETGSVEKIAPGM